MFGAALVGIVIGQSYDGTARPFAFALLIGSSAALVLVLFSERGKLFRRLNKPGGPGVPQVEADPALTGVIDPPAERLRQPQQPDHQRQHRHPDRVP
jgi:hypothetical protein